MKNLIYFTVLFFAVIYAASCDHKPHTDINPTPPLEDTISEARYNIWVANWKTYGQSYTANTLTEYFTMPTIDLNEFLQHPGNGLDTVAAARFVIGMEISGTDSIPHLMLVGANSRGQSMTDASKGQYIYDVTAPCPNSCGKSSLPK